MIRSLGADLMAISPELPDNTLTMAEKHAIPIDVLSDATSEVIKKYRLWYAVPAEVKALYQEKFGLNMEKYNGEGRWELPVPATYVLDRGGIVRAGEGFGIGRTEHFLEEGLMLHLFIGQVPEYGTRFFVLDSGEYAFVKGLPLFLYFDRHLKDFTA